MKFEEIQQLVPQGEHFDESAIINEGGYLSMNHLQAIEGALANNATALDTAQQSLSTANSNITGITAERDDAVTALATANASLAANNTKITNLEAQIEEFAKKPSGNGSVIANTGIDTAPAPTETPSFLSDNNPANAWADQHIKRKK